MASNNDYANKTDYANAMMHSVATAERHYTKTQASDFFLGNYISEFILPYYILIMVPPLIFQTCLRDTALIQMLYPIETAIQKTVPREKQQPPIETAFPKRVVPREKQQPPIEKALPEAREKRNEKEPGIGSTDLSQMSR